MSEDFFFSSDTARHTEPLRHARKVTFDEPLELELGGRLEQVDVVYETYGRLNERRDNAVLICHAISGDSHVAAHDDGDDPGWWDIAVGPGKSIDTNEFFVICPNVLGACRGSTGPSSINPATSRPFGRDFPITTIADMVQVQRRLVDHLGIERLCGVVGGSMGGHQVLHWATKLPDRIRAAIVIGASARLTSQALAFDVVGRNAIMHDSNFHDGEYYDTPEGPTIGLAIARMIGHITYLSREAMERKFEADRHRPRDIPTEFENKFSVGSYLGYKGGQFVELFDANSYITLSLAMDMFDLGGSCEKLRQAMRASRCRWLVISYTGDWLFPPEQSQDLVNALIAENKPVTYCNVKSSCGHDAFLLEDDLQMYGELMRAFLANVDGAAPPTEGDEDDPYGNSATSIFQKRRVDYDRIMDLIPAGAGVLDLGCGSGGLLMRLNRRGHDRIMGLEVNERAILSCVRRGLDVVHADLNDGLRVFADGQFDVVVLSQTLQAVRDVERVVDDMLRVGRTCIVSFPNFAYHKLRKMLAEQGRAPEAPGLLRFKWYDTPNIRFLSIADFEDFCRARRIRIDRCVALDTEAAREVDDDPNLMADLAIFVISR